MEHYLPQPLGNGITVFTTKAHNFGTDAMLLASYVRPPKGSLVCDLGAGCGIVSMLWSREKRPAKIVALELQKDACAQIYHTIEHNALTDYVQVENRDLRCLAGMPSLGRFDLVAMNPPYFTSASGKHSEAHGANLARREEGCTLQEVCKAGAALLRFGGKLALCGKPERLCDLLCAMRANHVEPKRLRFVAKNAQSAPWLVLCEGKRGGKSGLQVENTLFLYDETGAETAELRRIYAGEEAHA